MTSELTTSLNFATQTDERYTRTEIFQNFFSDSTVERLPPGRESFPDSIVDCLHFQSWKENPMCFPSRSSEERALELEISDDSTSTRCSGKGKSWKIYERLLEYNIFSLLSSMKVWLNMWSGKIYDDKSSDRNLYECHCQHHRTVVNSHRRLRMS